MQNFRSFQLLAFGSALPPPKPRAAALPQFLLRKKCGLERLPKGPRFVCESLDADTGSGSLSSDPLSSPRLVWVRADFTRRPFLRLRLPGAASPAHAQLQHRLGRLPP